LSPLIQRNDEVAILVNTTGLVFFYDGSGCGLFDDRGPPKHVSRKKLIPSVDCKCLEILVSYVNLSFSQAGVERGYFIPFGDDLQHRFGDLTDADNFERDDLLGFFRSVVSVCTKMAIVETFVENQFVLFT
jgi:hypothetical protein